MTDLPKEAVEAVAKRLAEYLEMGRDGNNLPPFIVEASATALLDAISPMLVADAVARERAACARMVDPPLANRGGNVGLWRTRLMTIADAIRARGAK